MCLVDNMLGTRGTKMSDLGPLSGSDIWVMTQVHSGCKPRGNQ